MEKYGNLNGHAGVDSFEIGTDYIRVRFVDQSAIYTYDYDLPGADAVEEMKRLAIAGSGLSRYIAQHVRYGYARKE